MAFGGLDPRPISRIGSATRSMGRTGRLSSPTRPPIGTGPPRQSGQQAHRRAGVAAVGVAGRSDQPSSSLSFDLWGGPSRLPDVDGTEWNLTHGDRSVADPSLE